MEAKMGDSRNLSKAERVAFHREAKRMFKGIREGRISREALDVYDEEGRLSPGVAAEVSRLLNKCRVHREVQRLLPDVLAAPIRLIQLEIDNEDGVVDSDVLALLAHRERVARTLRQRASA